MSAGRLLATAWFWGVFFVTCPVGLAIGLLVFAVTAPFDPDRRVMHGFICRWTFDYLKVNPLWQVSVEHRERLPGGPCVLVANHQSVADVVAVMGLFYPFKFVSKHSLFRLPVVGWLMRLARYVEVERGRAKSMGRMLDACRGWLSRGMSVLLFPEGTYSETGQLLPFRRGAFELAREARVPVVPILIEGTAALIQGDGPWFNPRGRVRVTVLPPIPADALGEDAVALAARVRAQMEDALKGAGPAL